MELVGKRGMADLGSRINHVSGSKMSEWAKKMLMKQGWSEGKGLGKNEDGIKNYVKVRSKYGTACMETGGVCMAVWFVRILALFVSWERCASYGVVSKDSDVCSVC